MAPTLTINDRIDSLAAARRRYESEAYHFVFHALDFILDQEERELRNRGQVPCPDRHVSALQLLTGLRAYAIEQYGPLARLVLERWGIYRTEDFGEIVFDLVEGRLLNKQECDQKSDFRNGFNFREAFDRAWRPPAIR
jgi:uncharacterized repeat protein (TIGR04138 family)